MYQLRTGLNVAMVWFVCALVTKYLCGNRCTIKLIHWRALATVYLQ